MLKTMSIDMSHSFFFEDRKKIGGHGKIMPRVKCGSGKMCRRQPPGGASGILIKVFILASLSYVT